MWCLFSEEISFETFTPIWSHVKENQKKTLTKIPILNVQNSLSKFGRESQDPPIGENSLRTFRDVV